jgi:hypothetical protein
MLAVAPRSRDELQYGGAVFVAASAFTRRALKRSDERAGFGQQLRGAWALVRLLVGLPRLEVSLTDAPGGAVIGAYLRERRRGVRTHLIAQGVLTLVPEPSDYLRGRRRQALRTNLTHAAAAGIRCVPVQGAPAAARAVAELAAAGLIDNPEVLSERAADTWTLAVDADGRVLGGALVSVDRSWAMINVLVASDFPARYALHTDVAARLGAAGVSYLFVSERSALALSDGLQYLQRILGYRVVNLRLPSPALTRAGLRRRRARGRRAT